MATTGPASGGVPSSSAAAAAAAAAVSTAPNSVVSTPAITSSSSVADGIASSATGTATATAPTPNYSKRKYIAFWDSDGTGVDSWIGKITGPFQNVVAPTTVTATTTLTSTTDENNNIIKKEQEGTYLYDALCAVLHTAPYIGRIVLLTVDYPWSEHKTTQKRTFIFYNVY
jgi:hypothetical protein